MFERCAPLDVVHLPFREALGHVLAADVAAVEDVPPFANSAVDGYAVLAASVAVVPCELVVVGEVAAGAVSARAVGPGEAIRIMTGAPVPEGADAMVMVEDTERRGTGPDGTERVSVLRSVSSGAAVRGVGDDVRAGTLLYGPGTVVTPTVVGVLASVNAATVAVMRRPRVAVLSTGDELVDDGTPLRPGQIRESNRSMLVGLVDAAGCEAVDMGVVRDDEAVLEQVLAEAARTCDAIVTSGGVSMGDYDVVKAVLSRLADMRWMQIAIRPAKPFAFGMLPSGERSVPVFGLPGNPVSSLVSFELLARPALRHMAGDPHPDRPEVVAIADESMPRRPDGKVHYVRVVAGFAADGRVHVRPVASQGSHQLASTSLASAIAEVPDGDGIEAGGSVAVRLLSLGSRPWT